MKSLLPFSKGVNGKALGISASPTLFKFIYHWMYDSINPGLSILRIVTCGPDVGKNRTSGIYGQVIISQLAYKRENKIRLYMETVN